jgi:CheY-like chemotaxis protein
MPKRRILVVDDHPDSAESLVLLLRIKGHDVTLAHDGPSALEEFARDRPELALLDIGLPGLDGFEVARRVRALDPDRSCKLVALTGYGGDRERRLAREAGFDEHLVKPVAFDTLLAIVDSLGTPAQDGSA